MASVATGADLSPLEQLGKKLFFDASLSNPAGQSCASCHAPEAGFSGPVSATNRDTGVYPGAAPAKFGNRKPPSAAYASFSPKRTLEGDTYAGGQFWDGRADTLIEQAKGPFLNPLEMNNATPWDVVEKVQQADYRSLFEQVYGADALQVDALDAPQVFDQIARAIAAYESSHEVNAFSSKYDAYLAGKAELTPQEQRGLELFGGKANCSACHPHERGDDGSPPIFTDFTYDNVGTPRNAANPFYVADRSVNPDGKEYRDPGLGGNLNDQAHWGKVKVPTLRNVARRPTPDFVKSYLHNGTFKSLQEVVRFYNRRDKTPNEFAPPDVVENVNRDELGDLGLSDAEEEDLVAFLETLSDRHVATTTPPVVQTPASPLPVRSDRFRVARDLVRVARYRQRIASGPERGWRPHR